MADTGGLLAALDAAERTHDAARAALSQEAGPVVLSPFVLAELDYLLTRELGADFALSFLDEVAAGAYELARFESRDVAAAVDLIQRYRDLHVGLADASLVVIAARYGTTRLLTLDERNFRVLQPLGGGHFTLVPADV